MTAEAIHAFFQRYVRAFVRGDVDGVVGCWGFPATISMPAGAVILDEPTFRKNTEALCGFYSRQGMADARVKVSGIHPLGRNVAGVTTDYDLYDSAGGLVAAWRNAYLLREGDGAIHAVVAVADAEIEAWAERGTPLLEAEVEGEPMLQGVIREGSVG
jgi:hypothetical protein